MNGSGECLEIYPEKVTLGTAICNLCKLSLKPSNEFDYSSIWQYIKREATIELILTNKASLDKANSVEIETSSLLFFIMTQYVYQSCVHHSF